jgi:Rrf2 family transcriptional regulator, nitric oxide-sensitive transcriptional repressor
MISQTAEYALRAMVYMAEHKEKSHVNTQIAEATKVPAGYLSKVLQALSRAGLVNSQRGLGGGFTLARGAGDITIFDVVQAVDPIRRITSCPLKLTSHGVNLCPLHRRIDDAIATMEKAFRESTLADLLAEPTRSKPLCPFPYRSPKSKA